MRRTTVLVLAIAVLAVAVVALAGTGWTAQEKEYDRLYLVSTWDALLQGVYDGTVMVATLERQGDTGTGTFDRLDGELTMIDGVVWQARSDGSVTRAPENETTPFASVTRFRTDRSGPLGPVGNVTLLEQRLDGYLSSPNLFASVRVDGTFEYVKVRAAPAQNKPYPRLVDAIAQQGVYKLRSVTGSLVGTYVPTYAERLAIPGWHIHFITDDRRAGGHVLGLVSDGSAQVRIDDLSSFKVVLPVGTDFTTTDFSQNLSADTKVVEKGQ